MKSVNITINFFLYIIFSHINYILINFITKALTTNGLIIQKAFQQQNVKMLFDDYL